MRYVVTRRPPFSSARTRWTNLSAAAKRGRSRRPFFRQEENFGEIRNRLLYKGQHHGHRIVRKAMHEAEYCSISRRDTWCPRRSVKDPIETQQDQYRRTLNVLVERKS